MLYNRWISFCSLNTAYLQSIYMAGHLVYITLVTAISGKYIWNTYLAKIRCKINQFYVTMNKVILTNLIYGGVKLASAHYIKIHRGNKSWPQKCEPN